MAGTTGANVAAALAGAIQAPVVNVTAGDQKVDPKAAKCAVCGEPTAGWAGFSQANKTFAEVTALIAEAKAKGLDVLYWQARSLDHLGRAAAAADIYRRITGEAATSYYAMWAERRLERPAPGMPLRVVAPVDEVAVPPQPDFHFERAIELKAAGLPSMARAELAAYEQDHQDDVAGFDARLRGGAARIFHQQSAMHARFLLLLGVQRTHRDVRQHHSS